jgi:toxin-antitoxin system PIN domain toxin
VSVACDANVLLYASDSASPRQVPSQRLVARFAEGPGLVYLFWPVLMAYLRIATHPGIFERPLTPKDAQANVDSLLSRPHIRTPAEEPGFWTVFQRSAGQQVVRGNLVPDAHLAALMRQHGVDTIWSADRDFRRFDGITARDPFA